MRAARFHGQGDLRVEDIDEPKLSPGKCIVDVEWCGICGSDLHEYLRGMGQATPNSFHLLTFYLQAQVDRKEFHTSSQVRLYPSPWATSFAVESEIHLPSPA